jgi:ADP-heptose:LPS heptosyltransferase
MSDINDKKQRRVLLIRFGPIGNALVAVPAIRALRSAWPEARLTLAADPVTLELMGPCPYLDERVRYEAKGSDGGLRYFRFIGELRRGRFTHVIHFKRHLRSELIGFLSGAPVRVGFKTEELMQLLTVKVQYREGENIIGLNLDLVRALGIPAADRRLEYWPVPIAPRVDEILGGLAGAGPLVVIHSGGSTQRERLWPGFAELAAALMGELGARVVLLGAGSERTALAEMGGRVGPRAAPAVGLPLPEAAELIRRADLFVGTDSGPAHLADAVGTPGAILYAPHHGLAAHLRKWKPEGDYLAFTPPRDCADCGEHPCPPERQRQCAGEISVGEVAAGLMKLYAQRSIKGRD